MPLRALACGALGPNEPYALYQHAVRFIQPTPQPVRIKAVSVRRQPDRAERFAAYPALDALRLVIGFHLALHPMNSRVFGEPAEIVFNPPRVRQWIDGDNPIGPAVVAQLLWRRLPDQPLGFPAVDRVCVRVVQNLEPLQVSAGVKLVDVVFSVSACVSCAHCLITSAAAVPTSGSGTG